MLTVLRRVVQRGMVFVSGDEECTATVTDASCGGASRFVSSDGESCVARCGDGEFLGDSGIGGSATCYTADSCRAADGGRSLLDGGTCVAATGATCYNLGSATYLFDGTACVDECAIGEFSRMLGTDNQCVDAAACRSMDSVPVARGAALGTCAEATARLCAQDEGRGFENGACVAASATTCDTSSGISFANGECIFCATGQGFDGDVCVAIGSLTVAERIAACGGLSRLYDSASPMACVNNAAACTAGKIQGRSEVMVNGTGSQAQCITVAQCAGGMFGVSDRVCVDAAAGTCHNAGASTYYFDTTNGCVSNCGASNARRTVGMMNTCVAQTDCRGATINGAVVRGECVASSGDNCRADGGRVYATTKCIANSRACVDEGAGLGYDSATNSCTTATAGACRAASGQVFFDRTNCVAMCGSGEGADDDGTCTAMANNANCMNAARAFDVAADECKAGNACAGDEFLGSGGNFGTNSCYTVASCVGAMGGRAMGTGLCVAAAADTCRAAGAATYYHDEDGGCVQSCTMGGRTITRALSGGNSCVTESDCRSNPHTGTSRGAVRSGTCVAANPSTCAEDSGRGFRNGVCVAATMQSCDTSVGIRFQGGNCVACGAGEGFLNNACTAISGLTLAQQIMACAGTARLYDATSTTCVATASDCTGNTIQGRSSVVVNGVPSDTQCITVAECAGGASGFDAGTNRCVEADAVTCRAVTGTTHYFDTTGGCVSSCSTSNMGGRTVNRSLSNGNDCVTPANCRSMAFAGSVNGAVVSGDCAVASGANCNSDGARAFNSAMRGCVESCIANDGGRGRDSAHNCVAAAADTCRIAGGNANTAGFFDRGASRCVQTAAGCGDLFGEGANAGNSCVTGCTNGVHGVNASNLCVATTDAVDCVRAQRLLQGSGCAEMCGGGTPLYDGTNTCVSADGCVANGGRGVSTTAATRFGRTVAAGGSCVNPSASSCYAADSAQYFFGGGRCVADCGASNARRTLGTQNFCVTERACRTTHRGAVVGGVCLAANAENCFADGGQGFASNFCATASSSTCDENFNYIFDDNVDMCVLGSFVDEPVTGVTTQDAALLLFTGTAGTATKAEQIATEYQNQPSLAQVGVAQAYVSQGADNGITNLSQLNIGNGSEISVITNKRFDPNHPEFWSSDSNTNFRTLSRFIAFDDNLPATLFADGPQTLLSLFFNRDTNQRVEPYQQGAEAAAVIATMSVGKIAGVDFETIDGEGFTQFSGDEDIAQRAAFEAFMRTIVGGSDFIVNMGSLDFDSVTYDLDASGNYNISLGFSHVGRIYEEGGNLASYQFVYDPDEPSQNLDGTYIASVPAVATDAEMGILALINGMLHADGTGGDANTHGVAPGAILSVFAAPKADAMGHAALDLIYRARSIDVGRDRNGAGDLIVDKDRNIVVIQNTIVSSNAATQSAAQNAVNAISTNEMVFKHKVMFDALNFGVKAPTDATAVEKAAQDIYVFAALDSSSDSKGVGAFAAVSKAATSKFAAYSVAVVAAESAASAFCGEFASSFCLAAPGAYKYRVSGSTTPGDGAATSNAAASLVAGGFALLEDRFGSQMGSDELVARMLATTSQCFNLNGAAGDAWDGSSCTNSKNDYVNEKGTPKIGDLQTKRYGHGLLDLDCATRPTLSASDPRCRKVSTDTPASCLSAMDGFDGLNCVTTGSTAADCGRAGGVLSGGDCIERSACGTFINSDDDECVAMCDTGEGATSTSMGMCTASADNDTCLNANRKFDRATATCRADNNCGAGEFLGSGSDSFGGNTCYTLTECVFFGGGLSSVGSGTCTMASPMTCYNAGASTYFLDGSDCETSCTTSPLMRSRGDSNDCVNETTCRSGGTGVVQGGNCAVPTAIGCAQDGGFGFRNDICVGASSSSCMGDASYDTNTGRCVVAAVGANAIIEAFRGTGNAAETKALPALSGITDSSDVEDKRRLEYANQPSLDIVGAAFAYGKVGEKEADIDAAIAAVAKAGAGSHISVITDKRFDPTHPEFSSATATSFKTLTRFYFNGVASTFASLSNVVPTIFADDSGKIVQVYTSEYDADEVWFSVPVGQIDGGDYEAISRTNAGNDAKRREDIAEFLATLVGGGSFIASPKAMTLEDTGSYWRYELDADGSYYIPINLASDKGIHHAGRTYDSGNLRSYQVVIRSTDWVRGHAQSGECNTNNDCYDGQTSEAANGREMGIFALINGLMNPDATGVAANTHGIAPGATLDVITTNTLDKGRSNAEDSVYRARSIDIGRDSGADDERNIVIIQNGISSSNLGNNMTPTRVNNSVGSTGEYNSLYKALQVGLADTTTQDAYVFAARDGDKDDVGILAALPISTVDTSILEYSIIVVAVEDGQTQCGSNTDVQSICIAAPGEYTFRARPSSGVYATSLTTATSANAAASLVAGGLALLESIFPTERTTRLIDRLLMTASKKFNLDDSSGVSQYRINKHGQGLMDLACAVRPVLATGPLARTGCVDRYPTVSVPTQQEICLDMMQGYDSSAPNDCVTTGITGVHCDAAGGVKNGSNNECIARSACTTVFNPANNTCLAACAGGTGANSMRVCGETASNDTCANATTRYDVGDNRCRANNNCGGSEFRGGGSFGTNSCYTLMECVDADGGRSVAGGGNCVTATEGTCFNAGAATYFLEGSGCVTTCDSTTPLRRSVSSMNSCVTEMACRDTLMGARMGGNCVMASAQACFAYGGRGFTSGTGCVAAADGTCDSAAGLVYDGSSMCIPGALVNVAVTGIDTRAKALQLFTGDKTSGTATVKNLRTEYQNQDSLNTIGAAQAYVSGVAMSGANVTNLNELRLGDDSQVSVIMNKRFDYSHPEFDSAGGTAFQTLTRFPAADDSGSFTSAVDLLTQFFANDADKLVEVYGTTGTALTESDVIFFTMPIGQLVPGEDFESVSRGTFNTAARRAALEAIFDAIVGGTVNANKKAFSSSGRYYQLDNAFTYSIEITNSGFSHVGRLYGDGSNIRSYQIVLDSILTRQSGDSGECITDNNCYNATHGTPPAASDAEMGVLALINGMLDGAGGTANTHGVAPGATLDVFTTPAVGADATNSGDAVYRARSIDAGRDRTNAGALKADGDRNIVIIQNNLAASTATGDVGSDATAVTTASTGVYKAMFDALKVGLVADTDTQDIYVFAARDGNKDDVGLLAGLPIATGSGFAKYSIIAVAVESGTTQCGANTAIQAICIAAPGAYKYRVRANDGTYTSTTLADGATANAAASLVAGGLALLQSIFTAESTEDLVARLLLTSSQSYDLDGTPGNDFSATKHGQGLMDLDCAVRPMISTVSARTRTGCEDRFAPDQRAICLGMMQGYDSSNPNDCVTSSITAAQCVAAGGVKNGSDDECIARDACATVFNAGEDTCLAMCASGEGATSARVCGATADNDNCLNAMRAFDVENSTCRDDPACASDEFLGGSGFGANSCYTVAECVDNNGGLSAVDSGTCIAATEGTCFNAGSGTYFLEGGECVTSCDSGTPLMRSVSSMNSCVAAMACRDTHMGAVIGSDCLAASGTNCNMDMGRAFNSAMTACVASCIADDSGRGRNASHECVAASASSCRIAGGNVDNMGFFGDDGVDMLCVQTALECDRIYVQLAEASNSGNSCVDLCMDVTHGVDVSENLCKTGTNAAECRNAGRAFQGGTCAEACSGATPVITAQLNATCVAAADCGAAGQGVSVENIVYARTQTVATSVCGTANAGSCYLAGNSTYFFQGSSCVDTCADATPLMRSIASENTCVTAATCRTGGAGAVSGTTDCVAASAQACLRDNGSGFDETMMRCVTATMASCMPANATFNSTDMVCEIDCNPGFGQNTIGACVALSDSSLSDTAAKIAACDAIGRLYDDSGTERCAENGADCGSDGIQGRAEVMVNSTGSAAQCITVAECAGAAYGVSSRVCVDATKVTCRGAGADTYFHDSGAGCVSQCNIRASRNVARALASGNDCVSSNTCRDNAHSGGVNGVANRGECVAASAETCANEFIGIIINTFRGNRCTRLSELAAAECPATINGMAVEYDAVELGCVLASDPVAVGSGKGGEAVIDTRAKALALFTGDETESGATDLVKNIRSEYQNQPSLGLVGAAQAYVSGVGESGADVESLAELRMGNRVTVSVLTNRRFDPTHSEFDSAKADAPYETLTRFRINNAGAIFKNILRGTATGNGSVYARRYVDGASGETYYFLAPIGKLKVDDGTPTHFDMIPRSALSNDGADDPQAIALNRYLGGVNILDDFDPTDTGIREVIAMGNGVRIRLRGDTSAYIEINSETTRRQFNVQNVGRLYHGVRNIRSYEIALGLSNPVRDDGDACEGPGVDGTTVDGRNDDGTGCYAANVPVQANAKEMGLLALITGLLMAKVVMPTRMASHPGRI